MHAVDRPRRGLLAGIWAMLRGPRYDGEDEELDPKVPRVAVKCDLCAGHNDYACVTACPVGAAARVNPRDLIGQDGGLLGLRAGGG
jgi:Fe-S-cluster-containing hydrogenase component 2